MRTVEQWFSEYGESHANPVNKQLHWICVPAIMISVIGVLWAVPVPAAWRETSPFFNWAALVALLAIVYYLVLSPALALGAVIVFSAMFGIVALLASLSWPIWATSLVIFVVAWIGQFIGHAIEGKRPSFFQDIQFLMIGPLWLLAFIYRQLGLRYS